MIRRPVDLYTAQQVRELDRRAIEDRGIDGYALMERAGRAAFRLLRLRWPCARRLAVFCGGGNNGGDGLVVARLALEAGMDVRVGLDKAPADLGGAAALAWRDLAAIGGSASPSAQIDPAAVDVVVDALLGTGLDRPVTGEAAEVIERINTAAVPVLALDIPSGLAADTGAALGTAVHAAATITFIGAKRGLYTGAAADHTGPIFLDDLDVPGNLADGIGEHVDLVRADDAHRLLPRRRSAAHKGDAGHVLVIGGDFGFAGAVRMAGEAALRVGAGLVTVATRPEHAVVAVARPELMVHGLREPARDLEGLLERADVVALGPGLGTGPWGRAALAAVLERRDRPRILDADALNLLATAAEDVGPESVITPHPGEAGRLLGVSTADVQADRFAAAAALRRRYGGTVLLKGAGTLVAAAGGRMALVPGAEPALASGGMGDVLTGAIAGLAAQGMMPRDAAVAAAWLHLEAAAWAAREVASAGLLATDLLPCLARLRDRSTA